MEERVPDGLAVRDEHQLVVHPHHVGGENPQLPRGGLATLLVTREENLLLRPRVSARPPIELLTILDRHGASPWLNTDRNGQQCRFKHYIYNAQNAIAEHLSIYYFE